VKNTLKSADCRGRLPTGALNGFGLKGIKRLSRIHLVAGAGKAKYLCIGESDPGKGEIHRKKRPAILQEFDDLREYQFDIHQILLKVPERKLPKQGFVKLKVSTIPYRNRNLRGVGGKKFSIMNIDQAVTGVRTMVFSTAY
jgi:hypothetical protein